MEYTNPISERVQNYAQSFDNAADCKDTIEIRRLIDSIKTFINEESPLSQAYIFYCIGNMYSLFPTKLCVSNEKATEKVLYYYRKSILEVEKEDFYTTRFYPFTQSFKGLLYTNFANELDRCGRKIAAIEQYQKAIALYPDLGMALGNLGITYQHYGYLEYDSINSDYFNYFAYHYLKMGADSKDSNTTDSAKRVFDSAIRYYKPEYIQQFINKKLDIPQKNYVNSKELRYRKWCLSQRLFLNTLNDLPISELGFAEDVLQLPNIMVDKYETPVFHGIFASLKQEYIYARYLYYEASEPGNEPLFADRETFIEAYSDYASYSIRLEKLKTAFKTLYGMFDKIAFFLANYFDIGFKSPQFINAKSIWKRNKLKNPLDCSNNIALSALYWICKDFFDLHKSEDSPNPELRRIADVRNFLEHRYVKIYAEDLCNNIDRYRDELAEYISEEELCNLTLTLLKVLREAMIYLSICVNISEKPKREAAKNDLVIPLHLMEYDDEWKR